MFTYLLAPQRSARWLHLKYEQIRLKQNKTNKQINKIYTPSSPEFSVFERDGEKKKKKKKKRGSWKGDSNDTSEISFIRMTSHIPGLLLGV